MSGEGISATNLPETDDAVALVVIKDTGGGTRSVRQISLGNFLTLVANAYGEVSVRAAADAQRAIGIASSVLTRLRSVEASIARIASDTRRALGLANNVSNRVSHLGDKQIVLMTQVFS
jgi:hypothetical protein